MTVLSQDVDDFGLPLHEGLSQILYHRTEVHKALAILDTDEFHLGSSVGQASDDRFQPEGHHYFLSMTRHRLGAYGGGNVMLVLDGRKLGQRHRGGAVDYWGPTFFKANPLGDESEDRLWSEEPIIPEASKYILEIHVLYPKRDSLDYDSWKDDLRKLLIAAKSRGIPIYVYKELQAFRTQNKKKAVTLTAQDLVASNPWEFKSHRTDGRDVFDPWLELFYKDKEKDLSKDARKRLQYLGYRDTIHTLTADLSNMRSKPEIRKFVKAMGDAGVQTPEEFLELLKKKWDHR